MNPFKESHSWGVLEDFGHLVFSFYLVSVLIRCFLLIEYFPIGSCGNTFYLVKDQLPFYPSLYIKISFFFIYLERALTHISCLLWIITYFISSFFIFVFFNLWNMYEFGAIEKGKRKGKGKRGDFYIRGVTLSFPFSLFLLFLL